mmetsp:Transcript_32711/g.41827  ORF Transcript_32711/g.41827 Transcript_32711/m.41827 type:complete len:645 (-) Transcript_32711:145-2079(-)
MEISLTVRWKRLKWVILAPLLLSEVSILIFAFLTFHCFLVFFSIFWGISVTFLLCNTTVRPATLDIYYARVFFEFLLHKPQLLSQLRPLGLDFYNRLLNDYSIEETLREEKEVKQLKSQLARFSNHKLRGVSLLSFRVMHYFLEDMASLECSHEFQFHSYVINQMDGAQGDIPAFLANFHQINSWVQASHYIDRVTQISVALEQLASQLQTRMNAKIFTPNFVMDRCIQEMVEFTEKSPCDNILYTSFTEKIRNLPNQPLMEAQYKKQLENLISGAVYNSYHKLISECQNMKKICPSDHGVCALPNGAEYYRRCLMHHTTTNMMPEQIHELGLEATQKIQTEMFALLSEVRGIDITEMSQVAKVISEEAEKDENNYCSLSEPEARAQILKDYREIIQEIDRGMDKVFDVRPNSPCIVERIPEFKEKGSPAAFYFPPALDGSKPGTFFANLRDVKEVAKFDMRTLAYHEGIPGHHFQLGVAQSLPLPFFRRVIPFTAYMEGYALYAEALADELGFHRTILDRVGYLRAQLFRAYRLVVDTGIHYYGWSREEAIKSMCENTVLPHSEIMTEIERYFVMPGQACAYYVGFDSIMRAREKAKVELGRNFDLKEFHNTILSSGALPLEFMEELIDNMICKKKLRSKKQD